MFHMLRFLKKILTTAVIAATVSACTSPEITETKRVEITGSLVDYEPDKFELEVWIVGPFFEQGGMEPLIVRGRPREINWELSPEERKEFDPISSMDHFHGKLEFYRGAQLIGLRYAGFTNSIAGVCLSPTSGRLEVLIKQWSGGASDPGRMSILYFDPIVGRLGKREGTRNYDIDLPSAVLKCAENERPWGSGFTPCQCDYGGLLHADGLASDLLALILDRDSLGNDDYMYRSRISLEGSQAKFSEARTTIHDRKVKLVQEQIDEIWPDGHELPPVEPMDILGFSAEATSSESHEVLVVEYRSFNWERNFTVILTRETGEPLWKVLHDAHGFDQPSVLALENEKLSLEVCENFCYGSATDRYTVVEVDLSTWSPRFVGWEEWNELK